MLAFACSSRRHTNMDQVAHFPTSFASRSNGRRRSRRRSKNTPSSSSGRSTREVNTVALSSTSKARVFAMSCLTSTREWRTSNSAGGNQRCVLCVPLLDITDRWIGYEATESLMYYSYPGLLERLAEEQKQEERDELLICDIQAGNSTSTNIWVTQ